MSCENIQKALREFYPPPAIPDPLEEAIQLRGELFVACEIREGRLTHSSSIMRNLSGVKSRDERHEKKWQNVKTQAEFFLNKHNVRWKP